MSTMFWIWLSVIIVTAIVEVITADLVSIWFTFGAILPFIFATIGIVSPVWQVVIFVVISAVLIASLRKITLKFLFRNSNGKTNLDTIIGQKFRLLEGTDFETAGKVKIKDVEWTAVGDKQQTIAKGAVVEVVKISGNKLLVKEIENEKQEEQTSSKTTKKKMQYSTPFKRVPYCIFVLALSPRMTD